MQVAEATILVRVWARIRVGVKTRVAARESGDVVKVRVRAIERANERARARAKARARVRARARARVRGG